MKPEIRFNNTNTSLRKYKVQKKKKGVRVESQKIESKYMRIMFNEPRKGVTREREQRQDSKKKRDYARLYHE